MKHRASGNRQSFAHRPADSASRNARRIRLESLANFAPPRAERLSFAKSLFAAIPGKSVSLPQHGTSEQPQAKAVNTWEDEGGALRHPVASAKRIRLAIKE